MSKKDEKLDPRVIRTRQLLRDALIELIPEKGFDALTVQDITDRATLNRATFYLHYREKIDLLMDVFDELTGEFIPLPKVDITALSTIDAFPALVPIFDHVAEYADFYRSILGKEGVSAFAVRVQGHIEEVGLKWFSDLKLKNGKIAVSPEIAIHFLGSAYMGAIAWWLDNDMPQSSEHMAEQLTHLTIYGLRRSMEFEVEPRSFDLP